MLLVAVMGLVFNLIQMRILHSSDGHYHLSDEIETHSENESEEGMKDEKN
jgi:hypothetical protein